MSLSEERLVTLLTRLENLANRLEQSTSSNVSNSTAANEPLQSVALNAFDGDVGSAAADFFDACKQIGADVALQGEVLAQAFAAQRSILETASHCREPEEHAAAAALRAPLSKAITQVQDIREQKRRSTQFNHLSAISEGVAAFGWVAVSPNPVPYIKQMAESAQFYTNRVLKDFRDSDPVQASWATNWIQLLNKLADYVKEYHLTGLVWNKNGVNSATISTVVQPKSGGAPPPPLPPPPPPPPTTCVNEAEPEKPKLAALFEDINKGEGVTSGLRKVRDDEKTHKNPNLRAGSTVPPLVKPKPHLAAKPVHAKVAPPKFELVASKWVIEHQIGNRGIVVEDTALKQTLYAFKCRDSTISVKGKINSVTLDSCVKTAIVFDDLISSIDIVNCQSVQCQVLGNVPTVNIDKCDGVQVFLSKQCVNTEIVTAKSSEMNVSIPLEGSDEHDYTEFPLPEQFKSRFTGTKYTTEPADN